MQGFEHDGLGAKESAISMAVTRLLNDVMELTYAGDARRKGVEHLRKARNCFIAACTEDEDIIDVTIDDTNGEVSE